MVKKARFYQTVLMIIPIIVVLLAVFVNITAKEVIENIFLDRYITNMELPPIDERIILILGSDKSVKEIGTWPWPRELYSKLFDQLADAKAVGFDILLVDESNETSDNDLAEAIKRHGRVILPYVEEAGNKSNIHSLYKFLAVAAGEGFVNGLIDSDEITRSYRLLQENEIIAPSFVLALLMAAGYNVDWDYNSDGSVEFTMTSDSVEKMITLNSDYSYIRYPLSADKLEVYDLADVINGKISKDVFKNAIVLAGLNAAGASDIVTTSGGIVSGTQFNVESLISLLSGVNPRKINSGVLAVLVLVTFFAVWSIAFKVRRGLSWIAPLLIMLLWGFTAQILFSNGILWLSLVPLILSAVLSYLFALLSKLLSASIDIQTHSVSIDSLLGLGKTLSDGEKFTTFEEYMSALSEEIEQSTGIKVLKPLLNEADEELRELLTRDSGDGLTVMYNSTTGTLRHRILMRLPIVSEQNTESRYALLGMSEKVGMTTIKSVVTIVATAYVYFNASLEAKKSTEMFFNIIQCMIAAIDAKDPITSGHSQRVAEMSQQIATWLSLPKPQVERIRFAGMIHDLGKIGIPDSVLSKPGPFSDSEFDAMKKHPNLGASIIQRMSLEPDILDGILYHHERLDGKGYPYGIGNAELTLTPRIIKLADVYDALISERQYKKAWSVDRVLNLINDGIGTEFDEEIGRLLIERLKPEGWQPSAHKAAAGGLSQFVIGKYESVFQMHMTVAKSDEINKLLDVTENSFSESLTCEKDFFGVQWYGSCYDMEFLIRKPLIVHAEGENLLFALRSSGSVKFIIYHFLRGFLTAGTVVCTDEHISSVKQTLGEEVAAAADFSVYEKGRMNVLCGANAVTYVMKSVLEN